VLRAKGLLLKKHDRGNVFHDDDIDPAEKGSEGSKGGSTDDDLGEGGWVAEQDLDLRVILKRVVSNVDSDHDGGTKGVHHDIVADGWVVENSYTFHRAVDLGIIHHHPSPS
jgi:hypothetical protein